MSDKANGPAVSESSASVLRRAAELMRKRAEAATPGPWEHMCLGSEGCLSLRAHGTIRERGHGRVARFGQKEWQADHADAEYVTAMHPVFAKAVAKLLDQTAWMLETEPDLIFRTCVDETIGIARAYLGEPNRERATDDAEAVTS